ncbi:hypothetical protein H4219_003099 [Mycoemilia scoparia]|uniref:Uncharacterized protein n=1 Tax=Mycoemilia scoparia TaxID=417184 RepID=A0A9W8A1J8_9FUNG|nr:hypothetical protein H4219_003099 [Mycoemilia scoparia]
MLFNKLITIATLTFTALGASVCKKPETKQPSFIVFGDSVSDVGNKLALFNQQAYWNGRFTNGPVWNEYTAALLKLPLVNYAFGGSTSSNSALINGTTTSGALIPSLLDQVDAFLKNNTNAKNPEKDIMTFQTGGNNILWPLSADPTFLIENEDKIIDGIANDMMTGLQKVYDAGYRRFLVWNVPGADKAPEIPDVKEIRDLVYSIITKTNTKIADSLDAFNSKNKPTFSQLYDVHSYLINTADPKVSKALNITDITTACVQSDSGMSKPDLTVCNNGYQHLYYDLVHPSTRIHNILGIVASEMINGSNVTVDVDSMADLATKNNINTVTAEDNIVIESGINNVPGYVKNN